MVVGKLADLQKGRVTLSDVYMAYRSILRSKGEYMPQVGWKVLPDGVSFKFNVKGDPE